MIVGGNTIECCFVMSNTDIVIAVITTLRAYAVNTRAARRWTIPAIVSALTLVGPVFTIVSSMEERARYRSRAISAAGLYRGHVLPSSPFPG